MKKADGDGGGKRKRKGKEKGRRRGNGSGRKGRVYRASISRAALAADFHGRPTVWRKNAYIYDVIRKEGRPLLVGRGKARPGLLFRPLRK